MISGLRQMTHHFFLIDLIFFHGALVTHFHLPLWQSLRHLGKRLNIFSLTIFFMMSGFFYSMTWFTGNATYHFDCLHDVWVLLQHDLVYRQCHLPFWLSSWCLDSLVWLGLQAMSLTILIVFMMSWFFSMTWFTGNVTYHFDCLHDVLIL